MNISHLFWLLPIGLVLLVCYRLFSSANQNNVRVFWGIAVFIVIGGIAFTFYYIGKSSISKSGNELSQSSLKDSLLVTPQEFDNILRGNLSDISEIFSQKNFYHKKDKILNSRVEKHEYYFPNSSRSEIPHEKVFAFSDLPYQITYLLKSKKTFETFFKYLKSLGCDSINLEDYRNAEELFEGNYPAYKYGNTLFIKHQFDIDEQKYCIKIVRFDLLEHKNSKHKDSGIKLCLKSLNGTRFEDNQTGDYIVFESKKGNLFEFEGQIENIEIKGEVKKRGEYLLIVSGFCNGIFYFSKDCRKIFAEIDENKYLKNHFEFEGVKKVKKKDKGPIEVKPEETLILE